VNDYDKRQYLLMLRCLRAFDDGKMSIHQLIGNLKALLACLQEPDAVWKERFHQEWAVLEEVNAVAQSDGRSELSSDELRQVQDAVSTIKKILDELSIQ
jgi:hypothetical protein